MTSLFGAFGSGGLCLAIAVWVILGSRKNRGKLAEKHKRDHTAWWMILFGLFATAGGQAFSAPATAGQAFTQAITGQSVFGTVGGGAVALIVTLILFALPPNTYKDVIFGSILPSIYAAAGGLWALPLVIAGSIIKPLIGA